MKGKGGPEGIRARSGPDRQVSLRKAAGASDNLGRQGQSVPRDRGVASRVQLRRHPKNAEHPSLVSPGPEDFWPLRVRSASSAGRYGRAPSRFLTGPLCGSRSFGIET